FPVKIHSDRYTARMITDAATSPDGNWLVFHAIGHLWKKRLPDGEPVRLTTDEGRFEYAPDISPDGRTVVFTTWADQELSTIRTIPLNGGPSTVLTERMGYYLEPRFSPDGSRIVFRRGQGSQLLGTAHGTETGIYWMSSSGGEMHLIREDGYDARFDH